MKMEKIIQVTIVATSIIAYEAATRLQLVDSFSFIPFSEMLRQMLSNLADPTFVNRHLIPTAFEILMTFMGAMLLGVIGGILLWRSNYLNHIFQPYLLLMYAIPIFALYPILVSIFGVGPVPVVVSGLLLATPAVISNTAIGFRETKEILVKVGRSLQLPFWKMLVYVFFPAAWPHIFTGLRLSVAYSIIGVVATEFILSARGIGYTISYGYNNFDLYNMYASILLVISFALIITATLGYIESSLYRRRGL